MCSEFEYSGSDRLVQGSARRLLPSAICQDVGIFICLSLAQCGCCIFVARVDVTRDADARDRW